ncbi:hypothetical protein [Streptomyces cylindrosporus]|uniref:Saccharopine dehydrogenase n=1 Tax=Streptomyces cylindrosporus TaxID=2927583 RepID=A0ABS9Y857_9ACTN|nr:hypothetical protein [Streptomyces cylindrosporus]MCI3273417.1 hypothetical protein [Streptomyces cylindrosporus]
MKHRVLVAGGYGLVGGWIVRHLRAASHDIDLVIGGRRPDNATALAKECDADVVQLDSDDAATGLAAAGPVDLVIAALQDPDDKVLRASLRAGAAYIGIVRKADTVGRTAMAAAGLARRPALIMGHWQAGVTTFAALVAARPFAHVDQIALAALFDTADPIGPMTSSDSSAFFTRALTRRGGHWAEIEQSENVRTVDRGGPPAFAAQPMGVLDVPALVTATDAADIRFDIGMGDSLGTLAGSAPSHDIYIDLRGSDHDGTSMARRTVVSDPRGQAHLTALGVLIGAERVLGLDGAAPPRAGVVFPEAVIDPAHALDRLRMFGVAITTSSLPATNA